MFNLDDIISDYWRGYTSDQLERARFMAVLMILVKKGILTIDDVKETWESVEDFLKDIVKKDNESKEVEKDA